MKRLQTLIFLTLILFLTSCCKKINELEFEESVMSEIFPTLIDSTCVDTRIFSYPPPIYGQYNEDHEGHVSIDTTKATYEQKIKLNQWQKRLDSIIKDTSKIIIAFDPILHLGTKNLNVDFEKNFPGKKIFPSKNKDTLKYRLNFEKIKLNQKFKIKNISEFPKDRYAIWNTKYNFVFSGVIHFTRIQFDKDKTCGILDGGFYCGSLCGQGFRIYIKKINQNWKIDNIVGTWIS